MREYEWNAVLSIHTYTEKYSSKFLYLPSNLNDLNTQQLLHGKPDVPGSDNERLFL